MTATITTLQGVPPFARGQGRTSSRTPAVRTAFRTAHADQLALHQPTGGAAS